MNKNIKTIGITFIVLLIFVTAKGQKRYPEDLWTVEQVKQMAAKYNLQDSISATKNTLLLTMKKEEIEQYFQKVDKFRQETIVYKSFQAKTKLVRSYEDYFKLVESMPLIKDDVVQNLGGTEKYERYKKEVSKDKWRIYRDQAGNLRFFKASTVIKPAELKMGQRLDNLQKN